MQQLKRFTTIETNLESIPKENPRIAFPCTILSLNPESLEAVVSSESKEARLLLEKEQFKTLEVGKVFRIIGKPLQARNLNQGFKSAHLSKAQIGKPWENTLREKPLQSQGEEILIRAEAVQTFNTDLGLLKQVQQLESKEYAVIK